MATGHGGNLRELAARAGLDRDALLDFSASVNPLGPPDALRMTLSLAIDQLVHYPDPECAELVAAIAEQFQVDGGRIVVGNGSTEVLFALARACDFDRALIPVPSYIDYAAAVRRAGRPVQHIALAERDGFVLDWALLEAEVRPRDLLLLGQPNNPTGLMLDADRVRSFAARHPAATLVVDEAFADFVGGYRSLARQLPDNLIVVRSLTKFYAIPGLRLGYAVSRPDLAAAIRGAILPWSVNSLAQAAGVAVLADEDYARQTLALLDTARRQLAGELARLPGLCVYPGLANYLLVRIDSPHVDARRLAERLLCQGIAIRTFDASQHLDQRFFRVAVRTPEENERLIEALGEAADGGQWTVDGGIGWHAVTTCSVGPACPSQVPACLPAASPREGMPPGATRRKKTPALMIQGTSSNAGKSVLVAALGRILLQDGIRVAPFKSQNMSLNSFVTRDGGEMGRAQAVQAQACRLEPDVRMNPILLKPNSETGSQVIVRGRPVGNMQVAQYIEFKGQAAAAAEECYDALAAEFDVMLLEGAGSPGEVNLKSHDIVNMRMARYAAAPVLVVGDIDRGGVFASFVGTMEVLAAWERRLVAGWIVNRFRGDAALLQPALDYTRRHTGRPVLGVVPFLADLDLPQEDSVEFKSGALDAAPSNGAAVEIAVIDLPHISNFTDFDAFRGESDVRLRIVRAAAQLQTPDAVIIPGSKNTRDDLAYLHRSGLARRIAALAGGGGTEVVGICGGFQMLGREVRDPLGIESSNGDSAALGLLDAHTVLAAEKTLVRTSARHVPSGLEVTGYEIHHGQTALGEAAVWFTRGDGRALGAARPDQRVWGTYLHGVFDADGFRRWFIDRLRVRRGLSPLGATAARYDIEPALDRLADAVRGSVRMDEIYRLLKL